MTTTYCNRLLYCCALVGASLLMAACSEPQQSNAKKQSANTSQSATQVETLTLNLTRTTDDLSSPGRVVAYSSAEIRPQVSGIVQALYFQQGSFVEKGEQLYQIDPAPFKVESDIAKANLQNALATQKVNANTQQRIAELLEVQSVSQQEFDDAKAALQQADAAVALAQAELDSAQVKLEYTKVLAPISGYIGPSAITKGALVTAQQATPLATIIQLDPIYVDIVRPANEMGDIRQALLDDESGAKASDYKITLLLDESGQEYKQSGELFATDLAVDDTTGSVTLRTLFTNPDGVLVPGMFVRAKIENPSESGNLLVPQKAVNIEADGSKTVWLVGDKNTVKKRKVTTNGSIANNWVIASGLREGDTVVVENTMMLRPGAKITTKQNNQNKGS